MCSRIVAQMVGVHCKDKQIRMLIYHLVKKSSNICSECSIVVWEISSILPKSIALRSFKTLFKQMFNFAVTSSASSFTTIYSRCANLCFPCCARKKVNLQRLSDKDTKHYNLDRWICGKHFHWSTLKYQWEFPWL